MGPNLILIVLATLPAFIVLLGVWILGRVQKEHLRRSPISRKVCRYPGYTLAKEVKELDDKVSEYFMIIWVYPILTFTGLSFQQGKVSNILNGILIVVCIFVVGFFLYRLIKTFKLHRNKKRGLVGEQVVGHELTKLLRDGFHVFHDIELDGENVDHVVVGPSGVFAIETKYRRKPIDHPDGHKVYYNGTRLKFWNCETTGPLDQAKRQKKKLLESLRSIFDLNDVIPVVVYPGWWVESESAEVEVLVLNEKHAVTQLANLPQKLSPNLVGRLAAYFEERSRDVEV